MEEKAQCIMGGFLVIYAYSMIIDGMFRSNHKCIEDVLTEKEENDD